MPTRRALLTAIAMAALTPLRSRAQTYPARPVRVVVPFPAGGGSDILIRLIQDKLAARLGQPIVVDNRPGASGNIGSDVAARAAPDGYTLLVQGTIIGIYPTIFSHLTYDPFRD